MKGTLRPETKNLERNGLTRSAAEADLRAAPDAALVVVEVA